MTELWDDPQRDFRRRYEVPEHFLWDPDELQAIDYRGYVNVALGLLPKPPLRVIDVGCGDGWVAREAVALGYRVFGVDYSERAIGFARLLVPEAEFAAGDVRVLAEVVKGRGPFDAALCIEVIEHIPPEYHHDLLAGIRRQLSTEGCLVLSVPSLRMPRNRWHYKHFSREEAAELLASAGFAVETVVNQHRMTPWTSPRVWRALSNRLYDARILRALLARFFLRKLNTTADPEKAGRYVYRARAV